VPSVWPVEELREAPVSGHIFRKGRQSGKAWIGRGRPPEGHLTKRGAQEVLDTIRADARRGRLVARRPGATVTFADAAEEWLRYLEHERGRRASTLRNYRLSLRNHILPALGQLPLTAVTVPRIDALRTYLIRQRGLAPSTVNQHLVLVHGILKRAQRAYGLPFNAASVVEHLDGSALRRRFYAAMDRAALKRIRFHDLRHTFGTLAVQAFPLTDVKAFMGHADISTTMI
jgi:integrase